TRTSGASTRAAGASPAASRVPTSASAGRLAPSPLRWPPAARRLPRAMSSEISSRKADHLDLCATDRVAVRERTTLLEGVRLIHQSLPELSRDGLSPETRLRRKTLRAPIVIAGMTGGHDRARQASRAPAPRAHGG